MQKRQFEVIAKVFKKSTCSTKLIVKDLAEVFALENERFDPERFIKACGLNPEELL